MTKKQMQEKTNLLFSGKTVEKVEVLGINFWEFHFSDGTKTLLEVRRDALGFHGIFPF